MSASYLREVGSKSIEQALKLGVSEAEAYIVFDRRLNLEFGRGIEYFKSTTARWLGLRVAIGKKISIYSTSDFSDKGVREAAEIAVASARASEDDPYWKSLARNYSKTSIEGLYDSETAKLEPEKLVEVYSIVENAASEVDPRVEIVKGSVGASVTRILIMNSYGDLVEGETTATHLWVQTGIKDEGRESVGEEYDLSRSIKDLKCEYVGRSAAEKAVRFLDAKPMPTGKVELILINKIAGSLVNIMIGGPISANWVQEGRSPLSNKLGENVASENFTLIDDATLPRSIFSRSFDDEGIPTRKNVVVEKGVLKTYLYDTYTAMREGRESTGNAHRTPYSRPQPAPNCLIVEGGDATLEEIIRETRRGLLVIGAIGEWLSNPVSGQLNATITQGVLIRGGEEEQRVKGVTISGDFWEVVSKKLEMIGKDLEASRYAAYSPTLKFSEVTVAGK